MALGPALGMALQARAGRAPGFPPMLRAARVQVVGRGAAPRAALPAWRQVVIAGGVLALLGSLVFAYRAAGLAEEAQLAHDLELARSLSPERQWHTPTDALIAARGFHVPVIVELPGIDNPFKESAL
jgi:hypothetical protein